MDSSLLLHVQHLSVSFHSQKAVEDLNFKLFKNETLGIVGESGSGKSVTSLALMGLLPHHTTVRGKVNFNSYSLLDLSENDFQQIRGKSISMVFQDPMSALNPTMRCGKQVAEIISQHEKVSKKETKNRVLKLFEQVHLPSPEISYKQYPHQLSGGQQQRVIIAMALANNPQLLIADEPTTALDKKVEREIISLLKILQSQYKIAVIFVSHDLNLVAEIADRVLVMRHGKLVEQGSSSSIFKSPQHPYTKGLLYARPPKGKRPKRLNTVENFLTNRLNKDYYSPEERKKKHELIYQQPPIMRIKGVCKWFNVPGQQAPLKALNNISFDIFEGETLGLVGASGSGKSTLGNCLTLLTQPDSGAILFRNQDISTLKKKTLKQFRKEVQLVFQDPFSSLNPKLRIQHILIEPMKVHGIGKNNKERMLKASSLLESVGLEPSFLNRYPHEFSGGQRQRIGIARALTVNPKLIVCDESVSALDLSIQAQVLNLLSELKERFNFTYIFISHDLDIVRYMSDRLMLLDHGEIVKLEDSDKVFDELPSN